MLPLHQEGDADLVAPGAVLELLHSDDPGRERHARPMAGVLAGDGDVDADGVGEVALEQHATPAHVAGAALLGMRAARRRLSRGNPDGDRPLPEIEPDEAPTLAVVDAHRIAAA